MNTIAPIAPNARAGLYLVPPPVENGEPANYTELEGVAYVESSMAFYGRQTFNKLVNYKSVPSVIDLCKDPLRFVLDGLDVVNGEAQTPLASVWLSCVRDVALNSGGGTVYQFYVNLADCAVRFGFENLKRGIANHLPLKDLLPNENNVTSRNVSALQADSILSAAREVGSKSNDMPIIGESGELYAARNRFVEVQIARTGVLPVPLTSVVTVVPV